VAPWLTAKRARVRAAGVAFALQQYCCWLTWSWEAASVSIFRCGNGSFPEYLLWLSWRRRRVTRRVDGVIDASLRQRRSVRETLLLNPFKPLERNYRVDVVVVRLDQLHVLPDRSSEVPFAVHRYGKAMPQAKDAVPGSFSSPLYVPRVPAVHLQPNEFGSHPQHLARRLEPYPPSCEASLAPVRPAPAYVSQPGNGLASVAGRDHDCVVISRELVCITKLRIHHVNQIPAAHATMEAHGTGLPGARPLSCGHPISARPVATSFGHPSVPVGSYPLLFLPGAFPQYVPQRRRWSCPR